MSRVLLLLLCVASVSAHAVDYRIETVAAGLDHPWSLAFLPGGDALVTERAGRLRVIERGRLRAAPVAGVPPVLAAAQAGLFEIAVDPRFAANGFVYLSFAHGSSDANRLRVVRARYAADGLHEVTPIFDAQPDKRGDVHYGARIAFLADETLVIGVGDGFVHREQAQRLDNHLGKLVRITRDGTVPPDNPFARRAGARPEIYSLGHRNPQGLVFDAERGVLYQHEHGPRGGDELNTIRAGANYGWPLASLGLDYTGARISPWTAYPRTEPPRWDWTPSIAPAGLALYRGRMFPAWRDSLFVAALVEKSVQRLSLRDGEPVASERLFAELGERMRDVREGPDGTLWLLTDSREGRVLRVVPRPPP
jgi:glucose/arabinose dehydrogenase